MPEGGEKGMSRFPFDQLGRVAVQADSLLFRIAQTTDELVQAYKLVYRNYLRAEYIDPHPSEMRYSAFNVLPQTSTFVAKLRDSVVTTASIVFDSPLGLPMDLIYHDELDDLRRAGARLAEVTMLADRRRAGMRTIPSLLQLFKLVLHYTLRQEHVTDVVITINPSHDAFYTRYLPFDNLAGLRYYPSVKNAPALAKRSHLAELTDRTKWARLYDFFMQMESPDLVLATKKRWTEQELRDLFVIRRNILPRLPEPQLDYVRSCYPQYDFDKILAPAGE